MRLHHAAVLATFVAATLTSAATAQTTFSPTYYPLGSQPQEAIHVDLNSDGVPDIVLMANGTTALLSGNDGFTTRAYSFNGSATYVPLVAGDFNNDRKADVIFYNYTGGSQLFDVAYGDGQGDFPAIAACPNPPGVITGTDYGIQAVAADFNGDGRADFAVAYNVRNSDNTYTTNVELYLNNGSGFTDAGSIYSNQWPSGAAGVLYSPTPPIDLLLGDFNAEGHADIAVRVYHSAPDNPTTPSADLTVLFGDGEGHFTSTPVFSGRQTNLIFTAADINNDGRTDLVGADYSSVHILYGKPSREFEEINVYTNTGVTFLPVRPQVADLDGNGLKDVALAEEGPSTSTGVEFGLNALYQTAADAFALGNFNSVDSFQTYFGSNSFTDLLVDDFNHDSKPDAVLFTSGDAQTYPNSAAVLLNTGSHALSNCPSPSVGIQVCPRPTLADNLANFNFSAAMFYPVRKMEVWIDGAKRSETYQVFAGQGFSNVTLPVAPGQHQVDLYAVSSDQTILEHARYPLTVR